MSGSAQCSAVPALKNILYTTDFSPCSQVALPYLRTIAERYGSTIHVVHVLSPEARTAVPMDDFAELDAERNTAESAYENSAVRQSLWSHRSYRDHRTGTAVGSPRRIHRREKH